MIRTFESSKELALATARIMADEIKKKPDLLMCFAAGYTQIETYGILADIVKTENIDVSRMRAVGLDDWAGFGHGDEGSFFEFINTYVFKPLGLKDSQYFFFDGREKDLKGECAKADAYLDKYGPIDFIVLGVGLNGHLGFNEPGEDLNARTHIITLSPKSREIAKRYFADTGVIVENGITLGLGDIKKAKKIIVQSTGEHKAQITKQFIQGEITNQVPASLSRSWEQADIFIDAQAAALL